MKHLGSKLAVSAAAFLIGLPGNEARADLLVDSFSDQNFVAESWGNAEWKDPDSVLGQGTATRTTNTFFPVSVSGKPAAILQTAGDPGYRFSTGAVPASNITADAKKFQTLMLTLLRGANYNATADSYVRLTAWRDAAYSWPANSAFGLSLVQAPPNGFSYPRTSIGPWDDTGTNFVGLALETTPTAFVVPIKNTTRFKADPAYQAATGAAGINDWAQLRNINIGWRRAGSAAGSSGNLGAAPFVVDDLMLLSRYPAISVDGSTSMTLDEAPSANTGTFGLALTALPSHNVTISVAVPDSTKLEVSSDGATFGSAASVIFTTVNYATTRTITVRSKDGAFQGTPYECDLVFSRSTSDLWYGSALKAPIAPVHVAVNACAFDVPSAQSVGCAPQTGLSFAITNTGGGNCPWNASTSDSWITGITPSAGSGSGIITFGVLGNTGGQRTGSITVGSHTHIVTQAAAPPPPGSSILAPVDNTIAGNSLSLDYVTSDSGAGIAETALWVKAPGSGSFVSTGLTQTGATGTFVVAIPGGEASDGVYGFASKATDTLGNSEPDPVAEDTTLIVNSDINSTFTWAVGLGDSETTYPMTSTQDVTIRVSGATEPGQITVSRSPAITPDPYFRMPEQVVKESLNITKTGLGTFSASIVWTIDPALAVGVSPIDTAFAFEGSSSPVTYEAVRVDDTVSISGVSAFSTWYLGNAAAVPVTLSTFSME